MVLFTLLLGGRQHNSIIDELVRMRTEHVIVVTLFIINQATNEDELGTGGTNPIPFLKKYRDETNEKKIVFT